MARTLAAARCRVKPSGLHCPSSLGRGRHRQRVSLRMASESLGPVAPRISARRHVGPRPAVFLGEHEFAPEVLLGGELVMRPEAEANVLRGRWPSPLPGLRPRHSL